MTELEQRVYDLLAFLPETPEPKLELPGNFWLAVVKVRTELKILDATRKEYNERTSTP